jgi:excisionase family DNA binding protein
LPEGLSDTAIRPNCTTPSKFVQMPAGPPLRGPATARVRVIRTEVEPLVPGGPATGGTMQGQPDDDALLTPSEVAAMFRVNPKTVTRWARAGKISAIRTLGGHRRFRASEIRRFLEQVEESETAP